MSVPDGGWVPADMLWPVSDARRPPRSTTPGPLELSRQIHVVRARPGESSEAGSWRRIGIWVGCVGDRTEAEVQDLIDTTPPEVDPQNDPFFHRLVGGIDDPFFHL